MASAFETAFAKARKAGKKTFTFNGKSYTTELKSAQKNEPMKKPYGTRTVREPKTKTITTTTNPGTVTRTDRAGKVFKSSAPAKKPFGTRTVVPSTKTTTTTYQPSQRPMQKPCRDGYVRNSAGKCVKK